MIALSNVEQLRGQIRFDEPMSKHTSWRVGGPADRFYQPADIDDLILFLKSTPKTESLFWLGLGSNVLIRDGGLRGTVIATSGALKNIKLIVSNTLRAEVGVASAKVARFSVQHQLTGAEFLSGIPGTIGGALAMNAGAFGSEAWEIIDCVETIDRDGNIHTRTKNQFDISYRHVVGKDQEWFIAAHFKLNKDEQSAGKEKIKSLLAKRGESQPTQMPNAGSVFKNPPGDYSARLIERSGLKGTCIGGACVSDLHANFIVNKGSATAQEIEALIDQVRREVESQQQVVLENEVRILGESL